MLLLHTIDRIRHFAHIPLGLLDRRIPIPFSLPSVYIAFELVVLSLLLLHILTNLAHIGVLLCGHDELEAAGLACTILLWALLSEVPPPPITACPSGLIKVTHCRPSSRGCLCFCLRVGCQSIISMQSGSMPTTVQQRSGRHHCRHTTLARCH